MGQRKTALEDFEDRRNAESLMNSAEMEHSVVYVGFVPVRLLVRVEWLNPQGGVEIREVQGGLDVKRPLKTIYEDHLQGNVPYGARVQDIPQGKGIISIEEGSTPRDRKLYLQGLINEEDPDPFDAWFVGERFPKQLSL
jgi:hypothetical protein